MRSANVQNTFRLVDHPIIMRILSLYGTGIGSTWSTQQFVFSMVIFCPGQVCSFTNSKLFCFKRSFVIYLMHICICGRGGICPGTNGRPVRETKICRLAKISSFLQINNQLQIHRYGIEADKNTPICKYFSIQCKFLQNLLNPHCSIQHAWMRTCILFSDSVIISFLETDVVLDLYLRQ